MIVVQRNAPYNSPEIFCVHPIFFSYIYFSCTQENMVPHARISDERVSEINQRMWRITHNDLEVSRDTLE